MQGEVEYGTMILGMSGSGIKDGNTERMVKALLALTGQPTTFVRLADLDIRPCVGCVKCARTNRCAQKDDGNQLLDDIEAASGVVLGVTNYFGAANGFAAVAMERLYPLRHREYKTAGKTAVGLVVGGGMGNDAIEQHLRAYFGQYMGFSYLGGVAWASSTPPCFSCGFGATCPNGMPAMMAGGVDRLKGWKVTPDMFRRWEDDPAVKPQLDRLAAALRTGGRAFF